LKNIGEKKAYPSDANFILFKVLKGSANDVFQKLLVNKIIIKNLSNSTPENNLLENCLRVTVGTEDENHAFLQALTSALV